MVRNRMKRIWMNFVDTEGTGTFEGVYQIKNPKPSILLSKPWVLLPLRNVCLYDAYDRLLVGGDKTQPIGTLNPKPSILYPKPNPKHCIVSPWDVRETCHRSSVSDMGVSENMEGG